MGTVRLVCVDGPAGSGKTTLGRALVAAARADGRSAHLLHMDDQYEGWRGLDGAAARYADGVVVPLSAGRAGAYRRFDWVADAWAEEHAVPVVDLLVVEGVGSGDPALATSATTLVWVRAAPLRRLVRGLRRDGWRSLRPWLGWMLREHHQHRRYRTRARADLRVDARGRLSGR